MGKVEEGLEVLTLGEIESRGFDGGDRRVVCSTKNRAARWTELGDGKLEERDAWLGELDGGEESSLGRLS